MIGVGVLVVLHVFVEHLRDALRDAAVLLALDEQRVHDRSTVVDGDVPEQLDTSGVAIDLDDRDVRAERERRRPRVEGRARARVALPGSRGDARRPSPRSRGPPTYSVRAGTPATWRPPSPITMSSGLASSRCAASCLAWASTSSLATLTALPAIWSDREPPVPPPCGMIAVSDCRTVTCLHRYAEHVARRSSRTRSRGPGRASWYRRTRARCRRRRSRPCPTRDAARPAR